MPLGHPGRATRQAVGSEVGTWRSTLNFAVPPTGWSARLWVGLSVVLCRVGVPEGVARSVSLGFQASIRLCNT